MPPEEHISEGLEAIIQVTAEKTVKEAMKQFREEVKTEFKLHAAECKVAKLGAFKATVVAIIGGVAVLIGNWIKQKLL